MFCVPVTEVIFDQIVADDYPGIGIEADFDAFPVVPADLVVADRDVRTVSHTHANGPMGHHKACNDEIFTELGADHVAPEVSVEHHSSWLLSLHREMG